jgi:hypothetical protein
MPRTLWNGITLREIRIRHLPARRGGAIDEHRTDEEWKEDGEMDSTGGRHGQWIR